MNRLNETTKLHGLKAFTICLGVMLAGIVAIAQPTTQASNITIAPVSGSTSSLRFDWTNGNGANRIVIVTNSSGSYTPTNGSMFTDTPDFGAGVDLDPGAGIAKCVYSGSASTITVTNISENTEYHIQIFEFDGTGVSSVYNISNNTNNPLAIWYYTNSNSFTTPGLVTSVSVQAWGGGGAGGGGFFSGSGGGGGGAGGSSVISNVSVTPANVYSVVVGLGGAGTSGGAGGAGGDSYFINNVTLLAKGGAGGLDSDLSTNNAVGSTTGCIGTTLLKGGDGGDGTGVISGGGGASAGRTTNGTNASGITGGVATTGGGSGANGVNALGGGNNGIFPGGAGSGGFTNGPPTNGGNGADGLVIVSYPIPDITPPTLTINQGGSQPDPSYTVPVTFDIVFSEEINPVTFTASDITLGGNAAGRAVSSLTTSDNINWTLTVTATGIGTITPTVSANLVQDLASNFNAASSSTDNTISVHPPPTSQATAIIFSSISETSMTVQWTNGNGDGRITLAKAGSPVDAVPVSGTSYTASSTFGSGTQIGTGNYVVREGTGGANNVSVTGLSSSTTYYFQVFEFNDPGSNISYLTSTATGNPASQATLSGTSLSVSINQDGGQADPTTSDPVRFNIVFSTAIAPASFTGSDITLGGTATGMSVSSLTTSNNITWVLEISATGDGTIQPDILPGVVDNGGGTVNAGSTSTDNLVIFNPSIGTNLQVFASSGSYNVPTGINTVKVQAWGGGGGGGNNNGTNQGGGGGGGGGAYTQANLSVTPGNNYTVTVGAGGAGDGGGAGNEGTAGGDSWFNSNSILLAKGGNGGKDSNTANQGGNGGLAGSGIGNSKHSGGNGGQGWDGGGGGSNQVGGGGGSSAGYAVNGNAGGNVCTGCGNGQPPAPGGIAPLGGGSGGYGGDAQGGNHMNGWPGFAPGGGGGGSGKGTLGGTGAPGQVIVTYTQPTVLSVTALETDGIYGVGETITIQVVFSDNVDVSGGIPEFQLSTTPTVRSAIYSGGSGTGVLEFTYTIQAGDEAADLESMGMAALLSMGAIIESSSEQNLAVTTLPTPGSANSLGGSRDIVIDGVAPSVTINQSAGQPDPTSSLPISFDIEFSEEINPLTLTTADFTFGGTAGYTGGASISTLDNINFTITIPVDGPGTIIPTINAGGIEDLAGNVNIASTSSDNTVTYTIISNTSDITLNTIFAPPTNIAYENYQEGSLTSASLEVAQFDIRDGGGVNDADANNTILTYIEITITNPANLQRVALFDGTTKLAEEAASGLVIFSGLTLTAIDNGSKTFSLRVSYNSTVIDNEQNSYTIYRADVDATSSSFTAPDGGGATSSINGDDNRIEVTATKLLFDSPLTTTPTSTNFSMRVTAYDALNNADADFTENVTIDATGGPGSISTIEGLTNGLIAGSFTWNQLQIDQIGNYTVSAVDAVGGLNPTDASTPITVTSLDVTPPILTFSPVNGATGVSVSSNLTISFNEAVRNIDNTTLTAALLSLLVELKLTNNAGAAVPFSATIDVTNRLITIDPTSDLTASTLYYLELNPVEDFADNATTASSITFTTGATPAPTTQASNITFTSVASTSMTVNWTNGDGAGRLVVARQGSAVNSNPVDATSYTGNAAFGSGTQIGTGNYVVYNGTGTSVPVTGLTAGTTYHFQVFEFNGSGATSTHLTTTSTGNPASQTTNFAAPTTQATNITFASVASTSMTLNWTNGNGTNRIVLARSGSAVNSNPTNGTTYTANAAFGSGTQVGTGNYVVYSGAGSSISVTGLTPGTTYHFRVYEFNGTGATSVHLTTTATGNPGSQSTLFAPPTTQATNVVFSSVAATSMTVGWTNGNGSNRIVVARSGAAVNSNPVDATPYTANTAFGSGTQIGTGNYVVYSGTGTSVNVTGLTSGVTYHFRVYEFNGTASLPSFLTATGTSNPASQATLLVAPTVQATNIAFSPVATTSMTLTWTNGDGASRLVVARSGSAVNSNPVNGTTYTANAAFASGTQLGTGNYVVYSGTGNSVSVTGLTAGTTYHFRVFEFNGSAATSTFMTATATGNPASQSTALAAPTTQATTITFSTVASTSMTVNWTNGNGSNRLVVARLGSAVNSNPVNGTSYTANAAFGNVNSELGTGNFIVYSGTGNSVPVTGLTAGTTYHFRVFEFNGTGLTSSFLTTTATGNPASQTTSLAPPTTQSTNIVFSSVATTSMTLTWTNGNGAGRLVLGHEAATVNSNPVNGTTYTANAAFGSGTEVGIGNYVVYSGTGNSVSVTGLKAGTTYHFQVFEFNGSAATSVFLTSTATGNPASQITLTPPIITAVTIPNTAMKIGDVVTATITVTNSTETFTLPTGSTIGGFALGSLAKTNSTTYTANFTVTAGGTDVAAGGDIPMNIVLNGAGGNSAAFTTAIAQANDPIDANAPAFSAISPVVGSTVANAQVSYTLSEALASGTITWTRTGGTADPNVHTQTLTGVELTAGSHDNITLTNDPVLVNRAVYSVTFAGTDAAGNAATPSIVTNITYEPDAIPPTVFSISYKMPTASPTNATSLTFQVAFREDVTGVTGADFTATVSGVTVGSITVNPLGANIYDVTIANVSGNGTVRLDVLSTATIIDLFNNAYVDNYTSGPVYTVDTVVPVISATGPASNSTVINTEVSYNLSEALVSGTITWTRTGGVEDATVHTQTLSGSELTVGDHSNITLANAPTLVVGAIYSISFGGVDAAGNAAAIVTNTEVTYAPDVTPPMVVSISHQQPANALTNEKSVTFRVVFSEPATHVDAADFTKTLATVFGGAISVTPIDETTYDVTFSVSGSGTVRLDVLAAATIMDLAGNDFNADFRDGAVYTIDQTPPVFSSISPNASTTVNGTEVGYTLSEELASGTITWTRTGGTEDPNTHVQELAATELAKGSHPSALLTNSPTLVSGAVYSIAFDGTDLAGNSSQTVVVNSIVYQPTANKLSDIVESTNFTYPQNIDNIIFQEPADIQNTGTSIVVAKFTIRDGGANLKDVDPFPTTLTGLTLDLGANSSVINRIALYDDAGEIEFEGSELLVANQTVSFTNIAIECPDNSERTFSIRVSFAAQVTDNSQFSLTITGTTTETGKSGLAAVDGGGASTSTANANNQIEVIATTFKFIQQPTNTFVNVEMSPAVSLEAVDENGNRDLDFEGSVVLTSSGSLSGDPTVLLTEGFGTYSSLVHSAGGAGLTLTASGGSNLQDGISALYDIYDDNDPIPLSIHSLITPTAHDANNNVLYIENIDFFPENTVKLIDRYGVSVKSWVNFSNYDTASPEQPDFDFSGLVVGNYICIVQFRDNQGDKRNQSQMITVLK